MCYTGKVPFIDQQMKQDLMTYTVEVDGDMYVVEDVPVRVDEGTGEPFFAADTVDKLQAVFLKQQMGERAHREWVQFSMENLARAYGDDEPDYSVEDVKERKNDPPSDRSDD